MSQFKVDFEKLETQLLKNLIGLPMSKTNWRRLRLIL